MTARLEVYIYIKSPEKRLYGKLEIEIFSKFYLKVIMLKHEIQVDKVHYLCSTTANNYLFHLSLAFHSVKCCNCGLRGVNKKNIKKLINCCVFKIWIKP